ncbi:putative RNA-binding protein NOB1 [Helianthus annuus]|uniref:RNA-binding protein NOB1 n=1 Tax=Helianthus annuus TaxID=4232 RepID=A0A251SW93_HELAN|nr:RNA-binding protein NOB1 [Helianthus annuus]KAF5774828.1 putative RNA-binding protein NOB1 [Helianthus annuus]KAJ0478082.1 putative RNA-binding protein NOB1 [Helianthus annuus]KAJ0482738.1 putative RNA-binding protein NOB1 [Helianthus annuus]KAJ0498962.1 putative RNA-binding protein NOB1 [Helianthus annuus]KAJ0664977.1 putative RNA-binding protein NOB1 [Helianthus annuus]
MEEPPKPTSCWSNIVKQPPPPQNPNNNHHDPSQSIATALVGSCKSTKGIAVAVVDANAIIQGGEQLHNAADKFVSVSEVIQEIRDPTSRHRLNFMPFVIDTMEPSPESLKKVISFAKATGDLQTLSDVDLKLIALTYTLEAQIHGTSHLRDTPPPIRTVNVKRLPEKDLPGWGSNVPNLAQWEALEHAVGDGSGLESRILPLKDLNMNVIVPGDNGDKDRDNEDSASANGSEVHDNGAFGKPRKFLPKKKEVVIDGKKMVAAGIDASQGQVDDDNADDWLPAVSRSTHRRFLRRKARREQYESSEKDVQDDGNEESVDDAKVPDLIYENSDELCDGEKVTEDIATVLDQMRIQEDGEGNEIENVEQLDTTSVASESVDTSSYVDDASSEQSWMLRSLSESSVACVTGDFAMQNVILQMGLRLVAPGGMQIRELHRWILKCHACFKVTMEIGKIFCPSCGNGGTLRKVAVTVGENGAIIAARRPRVSLRGTKFSLPLPQGGRDAITKNPILREDQLPQKFLHPKTKKKNKEVDDIFATNEMFTHHSDKRAPLQPPVRKALAVFSGKRNPNDNHYSRAKH